MPVRVEVHALAFAEVSIAGSAAGPAHARVAGRTDVAAPAAVRRVVVQVDADVAAALAPGHPSCHARVLDSAEIAAHPDRRVAAIALERTARDLANERKWGAHEQFDDTPTVSVTLPTASYFANVEIPNGSTVAVTRPRSS